MIWHRRELLALAAAALAAPSRIHAQSPAMSRITAYAFKFAALEGGEIRLSDFTGGPIVVVNTASQCGYTPQLAGLQQLFSRYHDQGLMVIGVPSNDFGGQEPGTPLDIKKTANEEFGVQFPLAAKTEVRGRSPHPFYKWAASERPLETPHWNFHKYLIGRDGHIAAVFPTEVEPNDPRVIAAITRELRNE